jgi:hypothetical protein
MANQQNKGSSLARVPQNATQEEASQILGYSIGDIVTLDDSRTSDKSGGGTSAGNTPNSTNSPGTTSSGSDMANINVDYSSGNSHRNPRDSHQAAMANAAPGQRFRVSRYDSSTGQFWAHKLDADGKPVGTEVPLGADENYRIAEE